MSGSVGPDTLLMVRASLGYTVLAPSFPSIFSLGILLSSEPLFSISSLCCLLTSHCKSIKILFRSKSTLRKQCSLPGWLTAIQSWLSPLQGTLAPVIATSTCRRHRLSLHRSLAAHIVNPVLPNVPDTLGVSMCSKWCNRPQTVIYTQLGKAVVLYHPSLSQGQGVFVVLETGHTGVKRSLRDTLEKGILMLLLPFIPNSSFTPQGLQQPIWK